MLNWLRSHPRLIVPCGILVGLAGGVIARGWRRWARLLLGAVSLVIPVNIAVGIGSDFGWGIATIGRIVLFVLIYSSVVLVTQPTVAPLRDTATVLPTQGY